MKTYTFLRATAYTLPLMMLRLLRAAPPRVRSQGGDVKAVPPLPASQNLKFTHLTIADGLSPEIERALLRLSAGEREVIALRVVLDLDAGGAARVLGISPTNCTTRLNRALKKLEEALDVAA